MMSGQLPVRQETLGNWSSPRLMGSEPRGVVKLLIGKGVNQETLSTDVHTLVSSSPHFANMLAKVPIDSTKPEWIVLPDENAKAMVNILKFLSIGFINPSMSLEEGTATLRTATKYQMPVVVKEFRTHIMQNMNKLSEAVDVLEAASGHILMDTELRQICMNYLLKRFPLLVTKYSDSFVRLSKSSILEMLKSEEILVHAEEDAFEACLKWARAKCSNPQNYLEIRHVLDDIFPWLRFPVMDPVAFKSKYANTGILSSQDLELLQLYWNLRLSDPITAEAMDLPWSKKKRTGAQYIVNFYKRKPSDQIWTVPANQWFCVKLWCDWSINIHSAILYGKPTIGRSVPVTVRLDEKSEFNYSHLCSSNATLRATAAPGNSSRIEFQPSLKLTGGNKYILKMAFSNAGIRDASIGSILANRWKKVVNSTPSGNNTITLMAKKVNGGDCLFHSIEYSFVRVLSEGKNNFNAVHNDCAPPTDQFPCNIV